MANTSEMTPEEFHAFKMGVEGSWMELNQSSSQTPSDLRLIRAYNRGVNHRLKEQRKKNLKSFLKTVFVFSVLTWAYGTIRDVTGCESMKCHDQQRECEERRAKYNTKEACD